MVILYGQPKVHCERRHKSISQQKHDRIAVSIPSNETVLECSRVALDNDETVCSALGPCNEALHVARRAKVQTCHQCKPGPCVRTRLPMCLNHVGVHWPIPLQGPDQGIVLRSQALCLIISYHLTSIYRSKTVLASTLFNNAHLAAIPCYL